MKEEVPTASGTSNTQQTSKVNFINSIYSFLNNIFRNRQPKKHNKILIHLQRLSMIRNFYEMFFEIYLVLMLIVKLCEQLLNKCNNNKKKIQMIMMTMTNQVQQKRKKMTNKTKVSNEL